MKPQQIIVGAISIFLAVLAGYFALILASSTEVEVGPMRVGFALRPAWHGKSVLELPPAGSLEADTHSAPAEVDYVIKEISVSRVEDLTDPNSAARQALDNWREPVGGAAREMLLRIGILSAMAGFTVVTMLRRRWQWGLAGATVALATAFLVGGLAYLTYDTNAFQEPRYNGNLAYAPDIITFSQQTLANLNTYEDRVPEIAESVYRTVSQLHQLPQAVSAGDTIKVLHISDMHSSEAAARLTKTVTDLYQVDFIVDTGDSTDLGTGFEAGYPTTYLPLPKPYVWVAGNHDTPTITRTMQGIPGVTVLQSEFVSFARVTLGGFPDPASTSLSPNPSSDARLADDAARIAGIVGRRSEGPFMVAVHDPKQAAKLPGLVPVVLNGHTHRESITVRDGTVFLDGGTTGGGGFRGVNHDSESPSTLQILYIQQDPLKLAAVDTITIYGFSQEFSVVRRVFAPDEGAFREKAGAGPGESAAIPAFALSPGTPPRPGRTPPPQGPPSKAGTLCR